MSDLAIDGKLHECVQKLRLSVAKQTEGGGRDAS